jgi:hypothetical protein
MKQKKISLQEHHVSMQKLHKHLRDSQFREFDMLVKQTNSEKIKIHVFWAIIFLSYVFYSLLK